MRRKYATGLAAVLAAVVPLQKEIEAKECKEQPCANQTLAMVPDQPHSHEEPANIEKVRELVEVGTSPPYSVEIGSDEYQRILATDPGLLFRFDEHGNPYSMFPEKV